MNDFLFRIHNPPKLDEAEAREFPYEVVEDYTLEDSGVEGLEASYPEDDPKIILEMSGRLTIKAGFLYDGPSGIAIDTADFMRGSGLHDGLYRLRKHNLVPKWVYPLADKLMMRVIKEDGMGWIRRTYCFLGVRVFGMLWNRLF